MRQLASRRRCLRFIVGWSALGALALAGCGGHHHLAEYAFANRSMALVYIAPPAPELWTGRYDLARANNAVEAVVQAGSGIAKEVEARRASVRLDSATAHTDIASLLAQRTLERAGRYLGVHPVINADRADYVLEVQMRRFGIDASRQSAAYLYTNAEAVLLDRHTGREIWSANVRGTDRLTPFVRGTNQVPGAIITAGTLSTVTVQDFEEALDQLANLSSTRITDELRAALRDVREKGR